MEYVEGGTLRERLGGVRSWRARLELLKAAGRGLAAAHAAGLVHRDFKPDNVRVGPDGRVRVTDFGIARVDVVGAEPAPTPARDPPACAVSEHEPARREPDGQPPSLVGRGTLCLGGGVPVGLGSASSLSPSGPLTLTGSVMRTVGYMAPEQALGQRVDARSDQFSFGVVLYAALYGEKPFADESFDAYVSALERPVPAPRAKADVPAWLRRVVLKGLSYSPSERSASMDALLAALDHDPLARRRRGALAIAGIVALGLAGWAVTRHEVPRAALCPSAASELAGTWDATAKDDVKRAFAATGAPSAGDSFARAAKALDAYASAWVTMRTEACEATIRRQQAPDVYRLRSECLREKTELRGLTSVLRRADPGVVASSVKAAYGLTAVSWCADVAGLRASPGLPADPAKRAQIVDALARIANASSLGSAGKTAEASAETAEALRIAREAGDRSTEAEARYEIARNAQRLGDYARAADELGVAMGAAYASGTDAALTHSAALLAFVVGDKLYRPDDATRALVMAHAGLERIGRSDELEAEVLSNETLLLLTQGYPDRAVPLLERVITDYRRTLGEHPRTALHLNNLGYADHLRGHDEEAIAPLTESRAMLESIYGRERYTRGIPICDLVAARLSLVELTEAKGLLTRALDVFDRESPAGYHAAWTLQYLSLAAALDGDPDAALAYGRRSVAIAGKLPSLQRLVPGSSVALADALLASSAPTEALSLCDRALEVQEKVGVIAPDRVYDWDALRCRGEALLAQHRSRDAVAPLERSVTLPRRVFPWDLARARLSLARALLETGGDADRARAVADEARKDLASLLYARTLIAPAEQWLDGTSLPYPVVTS